jgi:enoyl-CoA hydratase/carnithine racemase
VESRASIGAMPDGANVIVEVDGPMGVVRLDRPEKLNAFTYGMIDEIRGGIDQVVADPSVTAIVVTGTGRAFSAGLDTTDLARSAEGATSSEDRWRDPNELPALFGYLLRVTKPVIAAVNGVTAGGGFVLAMMCDLRFAAESASFTTAFSKRGLIAEHGTSWLLPRIVGVNRALDLLWSARRIDAREAYRIGFIDRVVPDDALLDEVRAYVVDLAATVSPRSMAVMKEQVYQDLGQSVEAACRDMAARLPASLEYPDAKEGVASFVERRPPRFLPWTGGRP